MSLVPVSDEVLSLINAVCDEVIDDQAMRILDDALRGDPPAQDFFLEYCQLHVEMGFAQGAERAVEGILDLQSQRASLQAAAANETTPASGGSPVLGFLCDSIKTAQGAIASPTPLSLIMATSVVAFVLVVMAMIYLPGDGDRRADFATRSVDEQRVPSVIVARITDLENCVWSDPGMARQHGDLLRAADVVHLSEGMVQITFGSGAATLLQGPVRFRVDSDNRGTLCLGKLTALVPRQASGFVVDTLAAHLVDLGTEFGVGVDDHGTTRMRVFQGRVRVEPKGPDGKVTATGSRVLRQGDVLLVHASGAISAAADGRIEFARMFRSKQTRWIDLADIVAGGDGLGRRRNRGIDQLNGRVMAGPPEQISGRLGDGKYHLVPELAMVDGVFVPDADHSPDQLDSTGRRYPFPVTSNKSHGLIWSGSILSGRPLPTALGTTDYATAGHSAIGMHANKAITFDLQAVRRAHPGWHAKRFLSVVGNTSQDEGQADIWVLVDGRLRYFQKKLRGAKSPESIDIHLKRGDRFLTLVSTDSGGETSADWIIFGDSRLLLKLL